MADFTLGDVYSSFATVNTILVRHSLAAIQEIVMLIPASICFSFSASENVNEYILYSGPRTSASLWVLGLGLGLHLLCSLARCHLGVTYHYICN